MSQPQGIHAHLHSSNGRKLVVESSDHALLSRFPWHVQSTGTQIHYATAKIGSTRIYLHLLVLGTPPDPKLLACALDRNPCHATLANIGWVSKAFISHRSIKPKRSDSSKSSIYRGVRWDENRGGWGATLSVSRMKRNLGIFRTQRGAALAYDDAARRAYGVWAALNAPGREERPAPPFRPREGASLPYNAYRGEVIYSDIGVVHVDPTDAPLVSRHRWHFDPTRKCLVTRIGDAVIPLPILVLGQLPSDAYTWAFQDHDPTNCTSANLSYIRVPCVRAQRVNAKRSTSPFIGVRETPGGRHAASIKVCGKAVSLGTCDKPKDAGDLYDQAVLEFHGPTAITNAARRRRKKHGS